MTSSAGTQATIQDLTYAPDAAGMVTITEIQPVKIAFNLPQGDLPQLQDRMNERSLVAGVMVRSDVAAAANSDAATGEEIPIKVDFVGNAVDDKTGTIELRATFDNPELRLVPGELVDVSVRLATLKDATAVPREAVNTGPDGRRRQYTMSTDSLDLVGTAEAAELLGVERPRIGRWIAKGEMPMSK